MFSQLEASPWATWRPGRQPGESPGAEQLHVGERGEGVPGRIRMERSEQVARENRFTFSPTSPQGLEAHCRDSLTSC
jgi:hypothetical protein